MKEESKKDIVLQKEFYKNRKMDMIKRKLIIIIKSICILIIGIAIFMVVDRSISFIKRTNMFNINNLVIEGNRYLSFNDIIDIIDIKAGGNIFNISLGKLKKKLEFHPRVESVFIRRGLPNKIIISLTERKPIVLLNLKKDISHCLYEIDKHGYIIGEYPYIHDYDLPIITGYKSDNLVLGEKLDDITFLNILKVLSWMGKKYYDFTRFVAEINIGTELKKPNITIYLNHFNTRVVFGENFTEDKLNKLNSLLMVIGEKISKLEYIDFKYEQAIGKYIGKI